ncbi:MAG TPA: hypothetical protein VGA25_05345 [Burkholderiales bacterium]
MTLSFRLTVVSESNWADTGPTCVIVQPRLPVVLPGLEDVLRRGGSIYTLPGPAPL